MKTMKPGQVLRVFFGGSWRSTKVRRVCGDTFYAKIAGAIRCMPINSPLVEKSSPVEMLIGMPVR